MGTARRYGIIVGMLLVAAGIGYRLRTFDEPYDVLGVVRATEVRIEPEVSGQLVAVAVERGGLVRAGDVVARLSALELSAQLDQARATPASAMADRDHVYAGVRREEVDTLKAAIDKSAARATYVNGQFARTSTLAHQSFESEQSLDQAETDVATAQADVAEAKANYDAAVAGPTQEERAIADARVQAAASAVIVLERRLDKTILRAPIDGVISIIAAEKGENVHAGQPVAMVKAAGRNWLSFNVREDRLPGLFIGAKVKVGWNGSSDAEEAVISELRPLGVFATWQAERLIGDHDRNTLRLRLDPIALGSSIEPGMTVWLKPQ